MAPALSPVAQATAEAHAFLAPSAAHRWGYCSGSAWMESQFPDLSDEEPRRTGTAAHWVLQYHLIGQPLAVGAVTPNGVIVDKAMTQGAELAALDIENKLRPYYGDSWRTALIIERRVDIPRVHPTHNWGTPDVRAWVSTPTGWVLFVWDYKFGFSPVEAFENDQLIDYSAGCMTEAANRFPAFEEARCKVVLTVIQPRAYHGDGPVRTWDTDGGTLRAHFERLAMAADEATGPNPMCRPRPDLCRDCRARNGCEALQRAVYIGVDLAHRAVPRMLNDDALGLELATLTDAAALLKARITGLEESVKARLRDGARVPYWGYGAGQSRLAWTRPESEVLAMGDMLGLALRKPPEAITPTQARDVGLHPDMLAVYADRLPAATKLVRVDGSDARRVFSIAPE